MLKSIRQDMGYSIAEMAQALGIPKSTYQCYEEGRRGEPAGMHATMLFLQHIDRKFMQDLPGRVEAEISKKYPRGFMSAAVNEDRE